jgi:hypothetical protein
MIQTEHKSEHMPNTRANTHLAGVSPIGEHIANTPEHKSEHILYCTPNTHLTGVL